MAVVSHPALSPEWSFPSPISPFDAAAFGSHGDLKEHTPVVHHLPVVNKRRARDIEWDEENVGERMESRAKKAKTSPCHSVEALHLYRENSSPQVAQASPPSSTAPPPQIEQVISILVDALTSSSSTTQRSSSPPPEPPIAVLSSNVPIRSPSPPSRPIPTSPLSNCPNRAPFVRKVIGGSCAGRTEPSLYRWVLCKNHFLHVRYLDPTTQTSEWVQNLHEMGWEELHPFLQAQASSSVAAQTEQALNSLSAFSRWIEDEFDYDRTEDVEGEWSDEDEDGELPDDLQDEGGGGGGQIGVWDSGIVLQLPGKS